MSKYDSEHKPGDIIVGVDGQTYQAHRITQGKIVYQLLDETANATPTEGLDVELVDQNNILHLLKTESLEAVAEYYGLTPSELVREYNLSSKLLVQEASSQNSDSPQ